MREKDTMQLNCPQCGTAIPATQINVQKLVAICPACDHLFSFDPPNNAKTKRRKVKKPEAFQIEESARGLHMAYRTNFRLDRDITFNNSLVLGLMFSFAAILMVSAGELLVSAGFTVWAAFSFYALALRVYNKTHIDMHSDTITVTRQPIANPIDRPDTIDLSGVEAFTCEETPISIRESYDTRRYRVLAQRTDGTTQIIVNDLVGDYGYFIAQQLREQLDWERADGAHADMLDSRRLQADERPSIDDDMPASAREKRGRSH
jgi:hypothetical protein